MALTTSQIRKAWDPPCKGAKESLAEAYARLDEILESYDYRPRSGVTGAYNCRAITGGSGYSLHAYGPNGIFTFWSNVRVSKALAVDINWDTNPYSSRLITDMPRAMVDEIKALRTKNGKQVWAWGGDYAGNKDAMHYEIVCTPADLATGIKSVVPPTPPPVHTVKDDKVYAIVQGGKPDSSGKLVPATGEWWLTDHTFKRHMKTADEAGFYAFVIRSAGGVCVTAPGNGVWPVLWPQEYVDRLERVGV